ncbi:hypothetical protein TcasGA2_TC016385 [Tribolium castaneum]|uniref:Uncharacterized protein n=1 Tax=Tribolium castaneum TaxID=7070 RepID=D6WPE0_TRICA|nr:hypothetical protein TcasGA2_TC016385 [Tribolium castaneum]
MGMWRDGEWRAVVRCDGLKQEDGWRHTVMCFGWSRTVDCVTVEDFPSLRRPLYSGAKNGHCSTRAVTFAFCRGKNSNHPHPNFN